MSVDRSLKATNSLTRHRNVLSRAERIQKLAGEENWKEGDSVFGLQKVANRNLKVGRKEKELKEEGTEGASATTEETSKSTPS